jgi:hypothetical protein
MQGTLELLKSFFSDPTLIQIHHSQRFCILYGYSDDICECLRSTVTQIRVAFKRYVEEAIILMQIFSTVSGEQLDVG